MRPLRTAVGAALFLATLLAAPHGGAAQSDDADPAPEATPTEASDGVGELGQTLRGGLEPGVLFAEVQLGMAGALVDRGPQVISSDGSSLGVMAAFTAGIRTIFFITPAFDIGYYGLGGSTDRVTTPAGDEALVENGLELVTLSLGVLVDLWRFRIRFGTGTFNLRLRSETAGVTVQTSQWDLGFLLGVSGHFYRHEGTQLGLEGRVAIDSGRDMVVLTLGFVTTFDALRL